MAKKEAEEEAKVKTRMKAKPYAGEETEAEEEAEARTKKARKEAETEEEEEYSKAEDEEPKEGVEYKRKKAKKEAEEDEDEEMEKDQFGGEDPSEDSAANNMAGNTTSPNAGVPSSQHVAHGPMTPSSSARNASAGSSMGQSPSEVSYSGKSVNPDLMKSPLYVELSKQLDGFQKTLAKKLDAIEKSTADRLANIQKAVASVENFYKSPFYKAISEETTQAQPSIKSRFEKQQIEFTH